MGVRARTPEEESHYWKEIYEELMQLYSAELLARKKDAARIAELEKENTLLAETVSDAAEQWDNLWSEYEKVCLLKAEEFNEDLETIRRTPEFFSTQRHNH